MRTTGEQDFTQVKGRPRGQKLFPIFFNRFVLATLARIFSSANHITAKCKQCYYHLFEEQTSKSTTINHSYRQREQEVHKPSFVDTQTLETPRRLCQRDKWRRRFWKVLRFLSPSATSTNHNPKSESHEASHWSISVAESPARCSRDNSFWNLHSNVVSGFKVWKGPFVHHNSRTTWRRFSAMNSKQKNSGGATHSINGSSLGRRTEWPL